MPRMPDRGSVSATSFSCDFVFFVVKSDFTRSGAPHMDPIREQIDLMTRRHFFGRTGVGLGTAALAGLLADGPGRVLGAEADRSNPGLAAAPTGLPGLPHFPPKARRAIYLFMNGGPSQMDLWDYKPKMDAMFDK